ncbi:MAG TPA: hypothetical protein VGC48_02025, partial [Gemmatimonadales bacterium]
PDKVVEWLRGRRDDVLAVVGHEPDLSTLAGYLLTGKSSSFLTLKKCGTGLLELDDPAGPGKARLEWLLTPRVLKQLGR